MTFDVTNVGKPALRTPLLALVCALLPTHSAAAHGYTFRVLYRFCSQANCVDGQAPAATLLMDRAGNLYGSAQSGGALGKGTIFRLAPPGSGNKWKQKTLYSFCTTGNCPYGSSAGLVIDTAGNLYGTTAPSSANDGGAVFELKSKAKGEWNYKVLYTFPCSGGDCPNGSLPSGLTYLGAAAGQPYDGTSALFASTEAGGTGGAAPLGVVFKLEPQNRRWKQTVLYNFCSAPTNDCADGGTPYGPPFMDSAGRLFGTTEQGGANGGGTVYSITGTTESVTYSFCTASEDCVDGVMPVAPVFLDNFGRIVGTTVKGGGIGPIGEGTLFAVSGANEQVLHSFGSRHDGADGLEPTAGVVEDSAGNIFGVTPSDGGSGNGVVFEYGNGALHVLYTFTGGADGCTPIGALIMDASGNLYGTASGCGTTNGGTVFELSPT